MIQTHHTTHVNNLFFSQESTLNFYLILYSVKKYLQYVNPLSLFLLQFIPRFTKLFRLALIYFSPILIHARVNRQDIPILKENCLLIKGPADSAVSTGCRREMRGGICGGCNLRINGVPQRQRCRDFKRW